MKGNSITAIVDCKKQQNREIARVPEDTIATDGIVLLGQEIEDNTFFPGSLNFISFFKLVRGWVPNPGTFLLKHLRALLSR